MNQARKTVVSIQKRKEMKSIKIKFVPALQNFSFTTHKGTYYNNI